MRAILFLAFAASACSSGSAPPPPPEPPRVPVVVAPAPTPPPLRQGSWQDAAFSAGDWVYRNDDRGTRALFGPVGQDAAFVIRCAMPQRRIYLSVQGQAAPGERSAVTIRTSSTMRALVARSTGADDRYWAAELETRDAILDAMAFSRGRFALQLTDGSEWIIRPWPELSRVIEDCR